MDWKLDDAKSRFSEVMDLALTEGPQRVRRRDDEEVVVVSADEYERLAGRSSPAKYEGLSFKEFLMNGPSLEGLDLERCKSPGRDVQL